MTTVIDASSGRKFASRGHIVRGRVNVCPSVNARQLMFADGLADWRYRTVAVIGNDAAGASGATTL